MDIPLKIALCENSLADREELLIIIENFHVPYECDSFSSGEELLIEFAPGKYDLIFLDIYMGDGRLKGVDAAAKIREADTEVMLIFTTSSTDHALESYRLKALKYLEKPLTAIDIQETLLLALAIQKSKPHIKLLIEGSYQDIPIDGILFFEQRNHAVMVHTLSKILRTSQTIRLDYIESLVPEFFLRCHHSFIVNLHYVREIDQELAIFVMQDDSRVHIRQRNLRKVVQAYENYLFSGVRGGGTR